MDNRGTIQNGTFKGKVYNGDTPYSGKIENGTFVGDEKILGSNTVTLANGMYITLGNEIFQFKN